VRAANVAWLRHQLHHLLGTPTDWIFWTRFPSPELVEAIEPLPFARIVYEPIDRYASSPRFSKREQQRIVNAEARLLGRATVIAGTGGLATQFRTASGGSHWLPFGYDAARQSAGPGLPSHIGRPRLAVVGGLDWRIDEDLLVDLAARQPNSQLILVGPCAGRWGRQLRRRDNVHWLGPVPPNRVGVLLRDCDVTLIPYRLTSWTRTCLPVKVFDYLNEGKPVVATPLPELAILGDAVVLALPEDFHAAVETASREDSPAARDRRRRRAARFTLQDRAQRAAALVNSPVARLVAR
jgi:glycosyltransferase involved in cell wall biosynthesis